MAAPNRIPIDLPKQTFHPLYARVACSMDNTIEKTPCFDQFKDLMNVLMMRTDASRNSWTDVPVKVIKYNHLMQCLRANGLPV